MTEIIRTFDDLEFAVRWELLGEQLPWPLVFTSREPDYESYQQSKFKMREHLRANQDPEADHIVSVLRSPDIRITVDGWNAVQPESVVGRLQLKAARKGDYGYIVKQLPGESIRHSGGFQVSACEPTALAAVIAAELPEAPSGKSSRVILAKADEDDDTDYTYWASEVMQERVVSVRQRAEEFLKSPRTHRGSIEIEQGSSLFGPRGIVKRALYWRDLTDDGRYILRYDTNPPTAVGAGPTRVVEMINDHIAAVVQTIRDERAGTREF